MLPAGPIGDATLTPIIFLQLLWTVAKVLELVVNTACGDISGASMIEHNKYEKHLQTNKALHSAK